MQTLRFSLQTGERICQAAVEAAAQQKVHHRTTPASGEAKTAVIVNTALRLAQRNTGQIFPYRLAAGARALVAFAICTQFQVN